MDRQLMAQVKNYLLINIHLINNILFIQVFRIKLPGNSNERGRLIHRRDINQVDYGHMSLNCIRWDLFKTNLHL